MITAPQRVEILPVEVKEATVLARVLATLQYWMGKTVTKTYLPNLGRLISMFTRIDTLVLENIEDCDYGGCIAMTALQNSMGQIQINRLEIDEYAVYRGIM